MKVKLSALNVADLCYRNSPRFAISRVNVGADGTVMATDGHAAIVVEPAAQDPGDGVKEGHGVNVPAGAVEGFLKLFSEPSPNSCVNVDAYKGEISGNTPEPGMSVSFLDDGLPFPDVAKAIAEGWKGGAGAGVDVKIDKLRRLVETLEKVCGPDVIIRMCVPAAPSSGNGAERMVFYSTNEGNPMNQVVGAMVAATPHDYRREEPSEWQKKFLQGV